MQGQLAPEGASGLSGLAPGLTKFQSLSAVARLSVTATGVLCDQVISVAGRQG